MSAPSKEAIAQLQREVASLDVEDLIDLCYAKAADALRTTIYLEALRGRGGEQAQVAACLLCFDLARRGDEHREAEVQFLLPSLQHLMAEQTHHTPRVVQALIDKAPVVAELWSGLLEHASRRDTRIDAMIDVDATAFELDLFDADDFSELALELDDLDVVLTADTEAAQAFDAELSRLWPEPSVPLFSSHDGKALDTVEKVRAQAQSFSTTVPVAAELYALSGLYLATHTRALGLFGRRNKQRDRVLLDGLTAWLALPHPPETASAYFDPRDAFVGAEPFAFEKIAELLLDVCAFAAHQPDASALPQELWAKGVAEAYVKHDRSARVPTVLAEGKERRRRHA